MIKHNSIVIKAVDNLIYIYVCFINIENTSILQKKDFNIYII